MTEAEKQRQFAEIFPSGKIEKYDWDLAKAKQLLEAVFDAVIKDSTIDENNLKKMSKITRDALQKLYDYVKPAKEHKKGLVFDENLYVAALELYEERFAKFDQSNQWDQRSFWCVRIEEYLASLLGTAYLRPHTQGVGNIEKNEKLKRDGCKLDSGSSYFAFRRAADSIPGCHEFVGYYGWATGRRQRPACWRGSNGVEARHFSILISSKNDIRDKVMQQYSRSAVRQFAFNTKK